VGQFSTHCFRMIQAMDRTCHAQHCPSALRWRGRFQDASDKWHSVRACDGHRDDRISVQRAAAPQGIAQEPPKQPFWT
jgi:hypothetical protein